MCCVNQAILWNVISKKANGILHSINLNCKLISQKELTINNY
ncbi:hypothetical protein MHA_1725 [Mannheimia haemolytica PHL213]|nr:hypothetical protein MHH_c06180 [Mannheimia haemolytica M42548]EDN74633.1 hypothetical protein MHA_1725 [Mannheimia haemolytica PHL213]